MHISKFEVVDDVTILIDSHELKIKRVAAVNCGSYRQSFVYVEAEPMVSTGLYGSSSLDEQIKDFGYAWEEYGLYHGIKIRREEYDDGAAVLGESPVELDGGAELRVRYLTPYNVLLAAHGSPINNGGFDRRLGELMNEVLHDDGKFNGMVTEILSLPIDRRLP